MAMTTLWLIEYAVGALKDYLQTNFAAKIADFNAQYADAIVLTEPATYRVSEAIEASADQYPLVEVLSVSTDQPMVDSPGNMHASHRIVISLTVIDDSGGDNIRTRVERYARAIVELVKAGRGVIGTQAQYGAKAYAIEWGDPMIDFSPAFRRRGESTVRMGCDINVVLNRQEVL